MADSNISGTKATIGGETSAAPQDQPDEFRLPTSVTPKHYDLAFKTDLQSSPPSFSGEAMITLDVNTDTSKLVFHLHETLNVTHLAISSSDLKTTSSLALSLTSLSINKDLERGVIDLASLPGGGLKSGSKGAKVWFRFESELGGSMMGYYKSEGDLDEQGKKPVYALTQCEATSARRAFPCWDEPLLKSTFAVSMIAREKETVLNNMPEVSSKPWKAPSNVSPESVFSDGYELGSMLSQTSSAGKTEGKTESKTESGASSGEWKIAKFAATPKMSTYLVAFACGEFASLSSEHKSELTGKTIPLRIFATPNLIKQAQFALDIKKWALPIYEKIFDIPYALPKLDTLVAHDFDAGAMENWGLITGRTTAYLYDPDKSPLMAKKRVASVQCHELAHMWFGDIVTMKWWDNLWLNEAFATLMGEVVIQDPIWPEWKVRAEFISTHLAIALNLDSQRSSHSIEIDCPDANNINQIFDGISYSKGAAVLNMLAGAVGEKTFLKGVSIYLKNHLYGNAETKDLWAGISEASGLDIAKIMANWTLKVGFPVISVEETGDGTVKLTQNRFLSTGDVKPEEDETLWWVPLEIRAMKSGKPSVDHKAILHDRSMTYDLGGADSFKLNAQTVGVYRVSYSPERLAKLGKEASSFSVEDRVGLVSDAATLARAGYAKTSGSLSLVKELGPRETEYLPWSQISTALSRLRTVWWEQPEPIREALDKMRISLFRPMVDKMGYENGPDDAPDVKELRDTVITASAAAKDPEVLAELKRRFDIFSNKNDDSQIPPDLQRTIYVNATRYGGAKEYEKMVEVYNTPPNPSTKVDAIWGLCSTKKEELLDRTFKMMEDGTFKSQDLYIPVMATAGNELSRRRIGEWFKTNYDDLYKRFNDSNLINYLVKFSFNSLSSDEDLEAVKVSSASRLTRLTDLLPSVLLQGQRSALMEMEFASSLTLSVYIRKYKLAVNQTLDAIQASADWLKRDQKDVEQWLKENKYL